MYRKILVPLDKSKEAEAVIPLIEDLLDPGGEVILLQVIPSDWERAVKETTWVGTRQEDQVLGQAIWYCNVLVNRLGDESTRWRCEVTVDDSIADGIANFAVREEVDLIMMYTHDRKGLAKLIKGSIAERVFFKAPIAVRVFKPQELVAV